MKIRAKGGDEAV